MVYHVIPAEAGIQDSQGDMNILDSGDPVPAKAGNRSDAQTAIFSQHQGDEGGFARLVLSIPKGHCCNLDVYKSLPASPIKAVDFDGVQVFHCGFFSISIELGDTAVIGAKLACILNA